MTLTSKSSSQNESDTHGGSSAQTVNPPLLVRVRREGRSTVIGLPKIACDRLGIIVTDLLMVRIVGTRLVISKLDPRRIAPISQDEIAAAAADDRRARGER